ncbi:carbohydrate ABC transporter permease [Salinisphaera sp.]|uniref:carbohydrate ABC transporter permease n=1 Tax=Salinisphaera sp. TaxID=1914330 RepID=UPI002D77F354|nr:carbohydrate ABC transporter permease [Salinisphaera sp.]HET7314843.1 carbohydrate ABC transporter permease [Salinisphaera sp.]
MVRRIGLTLFILFLLIPIYWLVTMSFKSNQEIITQLSLWPSDWTLEHYRTIFDHPDWRGAFLHSLSYVLINVAITLPLAIPAAYAFSRFNFLGDKHLFFWLLTNLMAPPAVFLIPYFQLYHSIHLFDTVFAVALAHTLFNLPLAVWILEGFMSGVPREIDETAYLDGYSLPRFFIKIFLPLIGSGIGVAAFFCFMFSWIELLLVQTLTTTNATPIPTMMGSAFTASGTNWGLLAAAGTLTLVPGVIVIWFVRNRIASGFALGRV